MTFSFNAKRFGFWLVICGGAFAVLNLMGRGEVAWATLQKEMAPKLEALLSLAVSVLLSMISFPPAIPTVSPTPTVPTKTNGAPVPKMPSVPLEKYKLLREKVHEWEEFGEKAMRNIRTLKDARSMLDTRQALYRVTMTGIIVLAFFVCVAGFLAIKRVFPDGTSVPLTTETFMPHCAYLLIPYSIIGGVLGVVVFRIHVKTDGADAFRSTLVAAAVVGLVSALVSLPYVFVRMWAENITWLNITMPMLLWLACFRLIVAPVVCACCGYFGFHLARMISRDSTSQK